MSTFLFIRITRGRGTLEEAGGIWHPQVELQVGSLPRGQPEGSDQLQLGTGDAMIQPRVGDFFPPIHLWRDMEMEGQAVTVLGAGSSQQRHDSLSLPEPPQASPGRMARPPGRMARPPGPSVNQVHKWELEVCFLEVKPAAGDKATPRVRRALGLCCSGRVGSLMSPLG